MTKKYLKGCRMLEILGSDRVRRGLTNLLSSLWNMFRSGRLVVSFFLPF